MEGILANQLDSYQEEHGLVHKRVYGFRKGRGTNTAMLEVWEFVLRRTEKGEMVAKSCNDKLSSVGRCTKILGQDKRKTEEECIILPRLYYCLETTSAGIEIYMEKLQGVQ